MLCAGFANTWRIATNGAWSPIGLKFTKRYVRWLPSEMASNYGSASFTTSQKAITNLCGLSVRLIISALGDLESAGVIIACHPRHGGRGQKTYTLLSCASEPISDRSAPTAERHASTAERSAKTQNRSDLQTLEVTKEVTKEEQRKGVPLRRNQRCLCRHLWLSLF